MKSHRESKEDLGLTVPRNRLGDREGKRNGKNEEQSLYFYAGVKLW